MHNTAITPKQRITLNLSPRVIQALKAKAKAQHQHLDDFAEALLAPILEDEEEEEPTGREATLEAMSEAKELRARIARGDTEGIEYVDTSSVEAMMRSCGL